ncbi:MAG: hypothetical protein ACKVQC_00705 [Elusimicrobiota bacterium]
MNEIKKLDLNDIASGKVELGSFQEKLSQFDLSTFEGQHVQLEGCAPTWAHLLVAGKLFGKAKAVDFLIDDGKEGKVISILK